MKYPVDLSLFESNPHNPSIFSLMRSMGRPDLHLVDFCVPVNHYFPTAEMFQRMHDRLHETIRCYPSHNEVLARGLAEAFALDPHTLVLANGSNELITWIDQLLVKESIATPVPTFGRWTDVPQDMGKLVHTFTTRPEEKWALDPEEFVAFVKRTGARVAVVCNPNNPTGSYVPRDRIVALLDALAGLDLVVIDESFIDFAAEERIPTVVDEAARRDNVLVLKSLGKNMGLHGIRFGYAITNRTLAERLRRSLPRWNVNALAEHMIFDLRDHMVEYEAGRRRSVRDRALMEPRLGALDGIEAYPSHANFVLLRLPPSVNGTELRNRLLTEHGLFVRDCGNKLGIDSRFVRIASRPAPDVDRLIEGLTDVLHSADRSARLRWLGVAARVELHLELPLPGDWEQIEVARAGVQQLIEGALRDPDRREAIAMVASELLENALKHGPEVPLGPPVLGVDIDAAAVRVRVSSELGADASSCHRLEERLAWLGTFSDPYEAYTAAVQRVFSGETDAGVGLARIAYEGRCKLTMSSAGTRVTVQAELAADAF